MNVMLVTLLLSILQQRSDFEVAAPHGVGLEWMVLASIIIPAIVFSVIVYLGRDQTA